MGQVQVDLLQLLGLAPRQGQIFPYSKTWFLKLLIDGGLMEDCKALTKLIAKKTNAWSPMEALWSPMSHTKLVGKFALDLWNRQAERYQRATE